MHRLFVASIVVVVAACGPAEVRLGSKDGIPPVAGSVEVPLDGVQCGEPIPAGDYQVTTKKVSGGCELSFDRDVTILKAADYSQLPDLMGSSRLLQAVELNLSVLEFSDTSTTPATVLDPQTRITALTFSVGGQVVVPGKTALKSLPKTFSLSGPVLNALKAQFEQRVPVVARAAAVVVLPDSPALPARLRLDYHAQPTLVLGL